MDPYAFDIICCGHHRSSSSVPDANHLAATGRNMNILQQARTMNDGVDNKNNHKKKQEIFIRKIDD